MKKAAVPKVPAAEVKRLARIRELARDHRRTGRALLRAMRAAQDRGIGVRKIAAAAGLSKNAVWRTARPDSGQPDKVAEATTSSNRVAKPKGDGK